MPLAVQFISCIYPQVLYTNFNFLLNFTSLQPTAYSDAKGAKSTALSYPSLGSTPCNFVSIFLLLFYTLQLPTLNPQSFR